MVRVSVAPGLAMSSDRSLIPLSRGNLRLAKSRLAVCLTTVRLSVVLFAL